MFRHVLLLTVWLGPNVFACPEGWWRSRTTNGLCLAQPQRNGILIQDSWTTLHWECRKLGATLASIRTTAELKELTELTPEKSWIGLASFDPTGNEWQWIRGSSSKEWTLANTTLFWGSENKPTFGRLRCGSLRSNGTIVISHCGSWQTGICELRLNEPKVPSPPQCVRHQVNSIRNESICYTAGGSIGFSPKCSGDFKTYALPTSFADIESMLAITNPCSDDRCHDRGHSLLSLPIRRLPNTDRWLDVNTNASVNWTNWAQPNAIGDGDCTVLNVDGFWERRPCESAVNQVVFGVCVGKLDASSSTIRPATVEPLGTGRPRPPCPPGARRTGTSLGRDSTCFMLSSDRLPWAAAGQRCRAMGGQLVNQFSSNWHHFNMEWPVDGVWIGLAALSGQWAWSLNYVDGTDWLPRDIGLNVAWNGSAPKVDESGRMLCASTDTKRIGVRAGNCGRSMRYVCVLESEQPPLSVPFCQWNFHILTTDTTSCLSVAYRDVSYYHLAATCTKLGGSPFVPSSALENEILLANGQKWNENSTSAPTLGQDLVWLNIRLVSSVQNSPPLWTKWAPGHPQNGTYCAVVDASNGLWHSLDCSDSRPSGVCRVPAELPTATVAAELPTATVAAELPIATVATSLAWSSGFHTIGSILLLGYYALSSALCDSY